MATIEKNGIRYFNIDCEHEDKLEFVIAKYGVAGYGLVVQLWRKIYKIDGYYCDWKEKHQYLFAKDMGVAIEFLTEVVNFCYEEEIFNRHMFDKYQVLTSSGVQKRWLKIVKEAKRKNAKIDAKYDLTGETPEKSEKTPEKTAETPVIDIQSKVKESKVNEGYTRDIFFENEILKFFGFNEISNFDKLKLVSEFCSAMWSTDRLEYFKNQFANYKTYINLIGIQYRVNFFKYLGKQDNAFTDGHWDAENWELKVDEENRSKDPVASSSGYPAYYSRQFEAKLETKDVAGYWKHLRTLGFTAKTNGRGDVTDWVKIN